MIKQYFLFAGFGAGVVVVLFAALLLIGIATRRRSLLYICILFFLSLQFLLSGYLIYVGIQVIASFSASALIIFLIALNICAAQWHFLCVVISYGGILVDEKEEKAKENQEMNV